MKKVPFQALIQMEGVNPYVDPPMGPGRALLASRGPGARVGVKKAVIPVKVWLDARPFRANLMPLGPKRTQAAPGTRHRLYLHGIMRKTIGKDVGDRIKVVLQLDFNPPVVPMNPRLAVELKKDPKAKAVFESLSPSHQKELKRYLNHLKSPEALQRNIDKVMGYLRKSQATWFGKKKPVQSPNRR